MPRRIAQKWRPPLALVIGGTLAAVFCLPLIGIGYFRVAGNILGWAEASWLIFWLALAATSLLAWLLWRLVLRPVYALKSHADAVKDGRNAPLPAHFGTPEFTALAQSVDEMAKALQSREAGIRAYSGHVTHELKSPLTSIAAAAELLQSGVEDEADRSQLLGTIQSSSQRMEQLLSDLRRLAAAREPFGKGPTLLSETVQSLVDTPLKLSIMSDEMLPLDGVALRAILEQFASNSAAHGATELRLIAQEQRLILRDNGSGIEDGNRQRIFDPFFTTRRAAGGTGMGLAIVKAMLEANGAEIALLPSEQGARFEITF